MDEYIEIGRMGVSELRKELLKARREPGSGMTNIQALGYFLLTAKEAGLDKETAEKLHNTMRGQFDSRTESEAEELGYDWYNNLED